MDRILPDAWRCTETNTDGSACRKNRRDGHDTCWTHRADRELPDEQRCTAKITGGQTRKDQAGRRCRKPRVPGLPVCETHGGNSPRAREAAKQRLETEKARKLVATYGLPVEISPQDAILAEVHRTAGHVAWLEQQVHALTEGELVWGITRVKEGGDDRGTTEEAVPHALLKLYNEERDRLVRVCAAALKAGVEERRVKLAEQQGALVADVIRSILADLKLTPTQSALVSEVVPRHLRALAATTAATN